MRKLKSVLSKAEMLDNKVAEAIWRMKSCTVTENDIDTVIWRDKGGRAQILLDVFNNKLGIVEVIGSLDYSIYEIGKRRMQTLLDARDGCLPDFIIHYDDETGVPEIIPIFSPTPSGIKVRPSHMSGTFGGTPRPPTLDLPSYGPLTLKNARKYLAALQESVRFLENLTSVVETEDSAP